MESEPIRLQKFLANQGIASRRKCEEFIEAGFVKVNGEVVGLGTKIIPGKDTVTFRDKIVKEEKKDFVYILLNKPIRICYYCKRPIWKRYGFRFS